MRDSQQTPTNWACPSRPLIPTSEQVLSENGGPAESHVPADDGRWVVLHGSRLAHRDGRRRVSVVIEAAQPIHLTSLLMRAWADVARAGGRPPGAPRRVDGDDGA